jgi:hypothetical protein
MYVNFYTDDWDDYLQSNLAKILMVANEGWNPQTQKYILNMVSNLPSCKESTVILESNLFYSIVSTIYTSETSIRELTYALRNVLMPFVEDLFLLK